MRILLSTIGTRGDVQPLVALALALRELGHAAQFCVPPDFCDEVARLGFPVTSVGPRLRTIQLGASTGTAARVSSEADRRVLAQATVDAQFEVLLSAARGCDGIVAATALQIAARSVAELSGTPYAFVAYAPCVLPSSQHAPPSLGPHLATRAPLQDLSAQWDEDEKRFDSTFRSALNARRRALGLPAVESVRRHVYGARAWLAADPILAPWPVSGDPAVLQGGAWRIDDLRPIEPRLQRFLDAGEPPVYFGFGSMRVANEWTPLLLDAARAHRRRAIVSRGWAALSLREGANDVIVIDEVNHTALFPRVAAVVHHGGAGTTTAAACAGVPQVVLPQVYDQHYWAERVAALGIGVRHVENPPTAASLVESLETALSHDVAARARALAQSITRTGARVAARNLRDLVSAGGATS